MTYNTYEFTAFTEADLLNAGDTSLGCGDTFTMPGSATVCFSVSDNDAYLSGDYHEHARDHTGQHASIEGEGGQELGNGGQIYAEVYYWVCDQDGNWYMLIEIEQEGSGDDYFTFHEGYGVPPEGAVLTVGNSCNVSGNWVDYKCLDAGEKIDGGTISGTVFCDDDCDGINGEVSIVPGHDYTIEAEHMWEYGFQTVHGSQASGGQLVKLNCRDGDGELCTEFNGKTGVYDVKIRVQDEDDGQSTIKLKVNGHVVEAIKLDGDNDGAGSDNGSFSTYVIQDVALDHGDDLSLAVWGDHGEWVRIDKIDLEGEDTTIYTPEPTKADVLIKLLNADGSAVLDADGNPVTTTSDADGNYSFNNVPAGDYKIMGVAPDGTEFTIQDAGSDDSLDSDVDGTGTSGVITVTEGETVDVDMGVCEFDAGTISGTVFCDDDCDGINGEVSIVPGHDYTIEAEHMWEYGFQTVHGSQASGGQLVKLNCRDGDGELCTEFNGKTGVYDVKIRVQDEDDGQSTIKLKVNGHVVEAIKLDGDNDGAGSDNGSFSTYVIQDVALDHGDDLSLAVWGDHGEWVRIDKIDLEGEDTTIYTPEPTKADVLIKLLNADGSAVLDADGNPVTTTTDADGNYSFENVRVGDYKIMGVAPDGTEFTIQDAGSDDSLDSDVDGTGTSDIITVTKDAHIDIDLGVCEIETGSISGTVWCDVDCDGIQDTVTTPDSKGPELIVNGGFEDNSLSNSGGAWGGLNSGWVDIGSQHVNVLEQDYGHGNATGDAIAELECGVIICQEVHIDEAGSYCFSFDVSRREGTSDRESSFQLFINGELYETYVAQGQETIEFNIDLPAGDVRFDFKSLSDTYKGAGLDDVSLQKLIPGETVLEEPVKEGVLIKLLNADGTAVLDAAGDPVTTMTDANGNYSFEEVRVGDYKIMGVAPDGTEFTIKDVDGNTKDDIDSDVDGTGTSDVITVTKDGNVDIDLGVCDIKPASISGTYFQDANGDGVDNDGLDVAGKIVTLLDVNGDPVLDLDGNPVDPVETDALGNYTFGNLPAGDYVVMFEDSLGEDLAFTDPNIGDVGGVDAADDSDVIDAANGKTATVSIVAGETRENVDAGVKDAGTASIGNTVFLDENKDGLLNGTEAGIDGITVTLLADTDGDGEIDDVIATDITENGGEYLFDNLDAGDYRVQFEAPVAGPNAGLVFTTQSAAPEAADNDSDANAAGLTDTITLDRGEDQQAIDAGLVDPGTARIAGRVFEDLNDNSLDDMEPGVGGVTVQLLDDTGTVIRTVSTEPDGSYEFTGLDAGTYTVDFDENDPDLAGKVLVTQDVDGNVNDLDDSDASQADGTTAPITLTFGQNVDDVDAGVEDPATASIGDTVFLDENKDGLLNGTEAGVDGVTVRLLADTDGDGEIDDVIATDVTENGGAYLFENLKAGDYKVDFDTVGDLVFTTPGAAADDAVDGDSDAGLDGITETISLEIGEAERDIDAGLVDPGTSVISGRVFEDTDNDDLDNNNGDEPGVGNVEVKLLEADGVTPVLDAAGNPITAITLADGSYSFTGLDAGDYVVCFPTEVDGKPLVNQGAGDDTSDPATDTGLTPVISVGVNDTVDDVDAGVEDPATASIGDTVFLDENKDGLLNGTEAGVDGVTVRLLADTDGDGEIDDVIATDVTENGGAYLFENLKAGDYKVDFDTVGDLVFTTPGAAADDAVDGDSDAGLDGITETISLEIGEEENDIDAGLVDPGTSVISGRVFEDTDNDDLDNNNGDEPGVGNVEVKLLEADGVTPVLDAAGNPITAITLADGSYSFTGLDAGDYVVCFPTEVDGKPLVNQGAGDDTSDPATDTGLTPVISVGVNETVDDVDAGVEDPATASIGDTVFLDENKDGLLNGTEAGVDGVTVRLLADTDGDGEIDDVIATDVTENGGAYLFENLKAGDYKVDFDTVGDLVFTTPGAAADDAVDGDSDAGLDGITETISLEIGEAERDIDAGLVDPGTSVISGRVFEDTDNDDLDNNNGDEPGVGNVEVKLLEADGVTPVLDAAGNPITAITLADGSYSFTGLDAGDYVVCFPTEVDGKPLVNQGAGDDTSDPATDTGLTPVISVGVNDTVDDVDAGVEDPATASIGDTVFLDENKDGLLNGTEAGVDGVTVRLLADTDGDGEIDDVIATDVTENGGAYLFENLKAGDYKVDFDTVGDLVFTTPGAAADDAVDGDSDAGLDGITETISLEIGEAERDIDAGLVDPGTSVISGRVFEDTDNDDLDNNNGDEPGVGNVEVKLLEADGVTPVLDAAGNPITAITLADGSYSFTGLDAGDYVVCFPTEVDGKPLVNQGAGDDTSDPATDTGLTPVISVGVNETVDDVDAGVEDPATASIGDTVFLDENKDGLLNGTEAGVDGVTVRLLADTDGDGEIDDVIATDVTENGGAYLFENLKAGDYKVDFDTVGDLVFTTPGAAADDAVDGDSDAGLDGITETISLEIGEEENDIDAGLVDPGTSVISGRVFEDTDNDDLDNNNGDEPGVGNVEVKLLEADGVTPVLDAAGNPITAITLADGSYSFTGLDAGDYVVCFPTEVDGKPLVNQGAGDDTSDPATDTGLTPVISVGVNETVDDVDAGVEDPATASIGDTVFLDENKDGLLNGTEAGVDGVTVRLLADTDGDGEIDDVIATDVTENGGAYLFENLKAGDYKVDFDTVGDLVFTTPGAAADDAVDGDSDAGLDGITETISLEIGEAERDIDAGLVDPGTSVISGRVFEDTDNDDLDNNNGDEPGVGNVEVKLLEADGVTPVLDAAGNPITAITLADGSYSFTGLDAGDYVVCFPTEVDGKPLVNQGAGDDTSDPATDTGLTPVISVGVNETVDDVDAGVEDPATASIGDTVFLDENKDGLLNGTEAGVDGVTVRLLADTDGDGEIDDVIATDVTENGGQYLFENLKAGDYKVDFDTVGDLVFTTPGAAADDAVDGDSDAGLDGITETISLEIGEAERDIDAGLVDPATSVISGRVFEDTDNDDLDNNNGDEPGVGNVEVKLLEADGVTPVLDAAGNPITAITLADGSYSFTGLDAGDYVVCFPTEVDGKPLVNQGAGDDTSDPATDTGLTPVISVGVNETVDDVDAGVEKPGSIAGTYFCDENNNDVQDAADTGIALATVVLLLNGVEVDRVDTNADGDYLFTNVAPGDGYTVKFLDVAGDKTFVAANDPDGNGAGDDSDDSDVILVAPNGDGETLPFSVGAGQAVENVDGGIEDPATASIGDTVWLDENKDGLLNNGEGGVENIVVRLINAGADEIFGTADDSTEEMMTNQDGEYLFSNLKKGIYKVEFEAPTTGPNAGLVFTTPGAAADDAVDGDSDAGMGGLTEEISLEIGEEERDIDAGLIDPGTASVGDTVFLDANRNGVRDPGEAGVDGVQVTLLADLDGDGEVDDVVTSQTTMNGGQYLFENLDAGDYAIMFGEPDFFDFATPGADADDAVDNDSDAGVDGKTEVFSLSIGETETDIDAGLVPENGKPEPMDDMLKVCADDEGAVLVLANDTDPEMDTLTITAVDGQAIMPGGSITTSKGTIVTLDSIPFVGDSLRVDGETAWAALDIGHEAVENISYTVTDGNGNFAPANLEVTFCGDANSVDSFFAALPAAGTYQLEYALDGLQPYEEFALDITFLDTGDARFDDVTIAEAYCLDFSTAVRTIAESGTPNAAQFFGAQSADALAAFDENTVSNANGLAGSENLDLINWIVAQNFEDNGYSGWEVQLAIWELADDYDSDGVNYALFQDTDQAGVDAILDQALALAGANDVGVDSFEFSVGDTVGMIVDPGNSDPDNQQPFIVALDWEDFDCLCIDNSGTTFGTM